MWDTILVIIVRNLIGDLDSSAYKYSDHRIKEVILVAAYLLQAELGISTYTIDLNAQTISPDPTDDSDAITYISLLTLKAACFVDTAELRNKAQTAVKIVDARSSIDTSPSLAGFTQLLKTGSCALFNQAKLEYQISGTIGHAIMTPIAVGYNTVRGRDNYDY